MSKVVLSVFFLMLSTACGVPNPEEYVNVLGGTKSQFDMSHGNILPEAQVPWGFNGWAPETDPDRGGWWFYSESARMWGIRCTHQPSPWIGDYGDFKVMGHLGPQDDAAFSAYTPSQSTWHPYYQKHTMLAYGNRFGYMTIELSPTDHGVVLRLKYPPPSGAGNHTSAPFNQLRRVAVTLNGDHPVVNVSIGADGLVAMHGQAKLSAKRGKNGVAYFHMTVAGGNGSTAVKPFANKTHQNPGNVDFDPADVPGDTLTLRLATSLISAEQARANHAAEVAGKSLDEVAQAAKAAWHGLLTRVDVDGLGPGYTAAEEGDLLTGALLPPRLPPPDSRRPTCRPSHPHPLE